MGANQIIVSPGVNGATLLGMIELGGNPLGGAGSAGNTGVQFSYTGSGTAFLIGGALASPGTSALRIENISIDLSGATGTSLAMNLANVHGGFVVRHVFFNGNGASSTQTGLQMNQGGNFTGDGIVEDNWFSNLQVGIDALGGGGGAVQEVLFSNNIGLAGAASSIGIKLGTTFGNFIYGSTFSSWTTAISVGAASSGNEIHWTSNTCTTDIAFIAGSTNNEAVFAMNVPPIVTDAGTNNRVIMSGLDGTLNEQGSSGAITGNSADQTFFTYTLPARALPPGRCLDVSVWANKSTGAVNTTYKLFFGSTAYVSNASTGTGQLYMEAHVCNNANSITAQHGSTKSSFPTVTFQAFAPITSAEATSGTVVIKATFNVANTDQLTPGNFNVRLE
jgi:hypothetical protein